MIQVLLCAAAFKTHADKGRPRNLLSQDPRRNHDRNANQGGCRPEPVPADPPEESQKGAPARSLRFCFPYSRPWREELREVDAEAGAVEASLSSGSQPDSSQHRSELSSSLQEERLSETFQVPSAPGVASSLTRNFIRATCKSSCISFAVPGQGTHECCLVRDTLWAGQRQSVPGDTLGRRRQIWRAAARAFESSDIRVGESQKNH